MTRRHWQTGMGSYRFEEESSKWWRMESPSSYALVILALFLAIGGGYYLLSDNKQDSANKLPIIEADPGPVKIMPENVGKTDVPHQDKLFYNQVNPKNSEPVVEHLLSSPEEPMQVDEASSESTVNLEETPFVETSPVSIATLPPKDSISVPEKTAPPAEKIVAKPKYRVQIAALSTADAAKREWTRLSKLVPNLLKSKDVYYSRVDLGAKKGIYYRIQIGKFSDKVEAQNFCRKLEAQKLTCMVVPYKK